MPKRKYVRKHSLYTVKRFDKSLFLLIIILLVFGLIMIYDATVILSQQIYGNAYRFVVQQMAWLIVGLIGYYIFYKLDIETIKKLSKYFFYVTLVFLFILGLFGVLPCSTNFIFSPCINGANRWFYLNPPPLPAIPVLGILGFQPSEFTKLTLILYLATQLELAVKLKENVFKRFLLITGSIVMLIMLQPNMSTATLIFAIGAVMYFASGEALKPFLLAIPPIGVVGVLAMLFSPHSRQRVLTLFGTSDDATLSTGYHIKQILIALGSGGLFGVGFGQSRQKFQYLPEVFADSIFAIIGEELGFFGTTLLITLFLMLIYKGYSIAKNTSDIYSKLLSVGITTWIGFQFLINVGAMTRLIPLTGVPLPLISYGGSSLVFVLIGLGILSNVASKKV